MAGRCAAAGCGTSRLSVSGDAGWLIDLRARVATDLVELAGGEVINAVFSHDEAWLSLATARG